MKQANSPYNHFGYCRAFVQSEYSGRGMPSGKGLPRQQSSREVTNAALLPAGMEQRPIVLDPDFPLNLLWLFAKPER
jgi:hypothetical protein